MKYFLRSFYLIFVCLLFFNLTIAQEVIGPETKFSFGVDSATVVDHTGYLPSRAADIQVNLDIDKDEAMEFIYVNDYGSNSGDTLYYVILFENNGNDSYVPVWSWVFEEEGNNFPAVRVTDMDEDGNQEVCVGLPTTHKADDRNAARLLFFEADANGDLPTDAPTYTWNFDVAVDNFEIRPSALETGDFDNDEDNELAVGFRKYGNRGGALAIVDISGELGPFTATPTFEVFDTTSTIFAASTTIASFEVHVADLDGDGNTEIMTSHFSTVSLVLYEATGADTYERRLDFEVDLPGDADNGTWDGLRDYNIDGGNQSELFYVGRSGEVYIVANDGDVSNIDSASFNVLFNLGPNSPNRGAELGDWDGDGNIDWFVTGGNDQKVYRLEYNGSGDYLDAANWDSTVIYSHTNLARMWYVAMGNDMDGDGSNELFITSRKTVDSEPIVVVLEWDDLTAIEIPVADLIPAKFTLEQNYPNPFNPETNISFSLSSRENVTLTIFNSVGEKIKTLIDNAYYSAGRNTVSWNGTNDAGGSVASGVYIYQLKVGYLKQMKRMMFIK
jgi:hypothetical protein